VCVSGVENIEIDLFAGSVPCGSKSELASAPDFPHKRGKGAASLEENNVRFVFYYNSAFPFEPADFGGQFGGLTGITVRGGASGRCGGITLSLVMTQYVCPRSEILRCAIE
jgi:hypothetical protein